jgi:hypothetical protein
VFAAFFLALGPWWTAGGRRIFRHDDRDVEKFFQKRTDSSFSEEKEAKRLLFLVLSAVPCARVKRLRLDIGMNSIIPRQGGSERHGALARWKVVKPPAASDSSRGIFGFCLYGKIKPCASTPSTSGQTKRFIHQIFSIF